MSHLNNAAYIDYFVNTREDQLSEFYGLDIYANMQKTGKAWVVAKNEILYKAPAFLMEKVAIQTRVIEFSPKHIRVEMVMMNQKLSQIKSLLWITFVPFDIKSQSSSEHDPEIMELLEQVHVPIEEKTSETRLATLITGMAATAV